MPKKSPKAKPVKKSTKTPQKGSPKDLGPIYDAVTKLRASPDLLEPVNDAIDAAFKGIKFADDAAARRIVLVMLLLGNDPRTVAGYAIEMRPAGYAEGGWSRETA